MSDSSKSDNGGFTRLVIGIVAGMLLSGAYIKFNWVLPAWMQFPGLIQGLGPRTVAFTTIEDPDADLATKQRAIEELLRHDPIFFQELDRDMGNAITNAVIDREARERLILFKSKHSTMRKKLEEFPNLRDVAMKQHRAETMDELMVQIGLKELREDRFLHAYLTERFAQESDGPELLEKALALPPQDVFFLH
tara:strand:- start:6716 stop:7294 length:579 start_codon:yes stop_codon:yes gene_type:complete